MTLVVTHPFVSPKPQGGDSTRVYGPQWNADHTLAGTADATQLNANVVQAITNDTNVTGSIASQNLTLGWTGTLAAARLNANVVQAVTNETNITGTISAQNLTFAWSGKLGLARGGTNADLSATGGTSQVLKQVTIGAAVTVGQLAFTDISGSVAATQMPALTGDITTSAGAVATTLATVNANVGTFGSATQSVQLTANAKGLLTAAANVTITPAIGSVTGMGTGVATFLATPSSANLRAALTDEVGTGAAYFVGGALGTPASGTATNLTGLPLAGLATQAANTIVGNVTGSTASPTAFTIDALTAKASPASSDELIIWDVAGAAIKKATVSSLAASAGVSSIAGNTGAFTLGTGLTNTVNDIEVSLSQLTNSLGADVALNNTANYFTGPSVAQGTIGTWYATGTVTLVDTAAAAAFIAKLWDGTTVIASARITSTGASNPTSISLSGYITSPAANIRISCRDSGSTSGAIVFNNSGNSKDSTLSVLRIA